MSANGGGAGEPHYGRYAWYALGVMVIVYAISFIDRQILSILAEHIKRDLRVDDAELGFLYGTAFAIFYTIFGIPLGRLVDGWHRARLMALGLAFWSLMTLLSGFAGSFLMLAIARVGVGIGEATASPAAYSMLADYFPERRRALVMSIYTAGIYLGIGASLPLGGGISSWWDARYAAEVAPLGLAGWQAAFVGVALPGLLLAPFVWRLREPARKDADSRGGRGVAPDAIRNFIAELAAIVPPFSFWVLARSPGALPRNLGWLAAIGAVAAVMVAITGDAVQWIAYGFAAYAVASWAQHLRRADPAAYGLIWGAPIVYFALLGFGALALVGYSVAFWAPPYALRTFGLSAAQVGMTLALPTAAASAFGVVLGGRLSDALRARDARGRIHVGMLSAVLPVPFLVAMLNTTSFEVFAGLLTVCLVFVNLWPATAIAAYQDFVVPRMYGTIGAIFILGSTMVGLALGPYFVGKIATLTGSLRLGLLSLLGVVPVILVALWRVRSQVGPVAAPELARASE